MSKSKMGEIEFPAWLPAGARRAYDEAKEDEEFTEEVAKMFGRLCAAEGMKTIWAKLEAKAHRGTTHGELFAATAIRALYGPRGDEARTPKQVEKRNAAISKAASKLATLLRGSMFDDFLWDRKLMARAEYAVARSWAMPVWKNANLTDSIALHLATDGLLTRDSISDVLEEMAPLLSQPENASAMLRPKAQSAPRVYFIRQLTQYCEEHFSGPRRSWVSAATEAAFNIDRSVSREVTRIAPSADTKKKKPKERATGG
jgi:hypothetical protein